MGDLLTLEESVKLAKTVSRWEYSSITITEPEKKIEDMFQGQLHKDRSYKVEVVHKYPPKNIGTYHILVYDGDLVISSNYGEGNKLTSEHQQSILKELYDSIRSKKAVAAADRVRERYL